MKIQINDNLKSGDCGLWYDVLILENNIIKHCICPYSKCKSFKEAITFYFKHFHEKNYVPIKIQHHKLGGHRYGKLNNIQNLYVIGDGKCDVDS